MTKQACNKKEVVKLANRSADTFDWQQNQPMEGFKLLLRFNLYLVSLVRFLSGSKPFNLLNLYLFNGYDYQLIHTYAGLKKS